MTNFFQNQEVARRATTKLVIMFSLAVIGVVAGVNLAVHLFYLNVSMDPTASTQAVTEFKVFGQAPGRLYLVTSAITVFLILLGSLWRQSQIGSSGERVAELLGGFRISPDTQDVNERRLLNVVEEMSIASGIPVLPVYVLEDSSINAFAAGTDLNTAVIGVTRGAIDDLNRDELQGVIAHEFSHVFNGDMRLNQKLLGLLAGIQLIGSLGNSMLRGVFRAPRSRSRSKNSGGVLPLILFAAALTAIGYIGVFFARMIKGAISRQREFLADATAVQYTRNPHGIGGALYKILKKPEQAQISDRHAEEMSHMFFGEAIKSFFETHPPLTERIQRIDPQILVRGPKVEAASRTSAPPPPIPQASSGPGVGAVSSAILAVASIAQPKPDHQILARQFLSKIPQELKTELQKVIGAQVVVVSILRSHDLISLELAALEGLAQTETKRVFEKLQTWVHQLSQPERLSYRFPLIQLCIATLRQLSTDEKNTLVKQVERIIWSDQRYDLFEFIALAAIKKSLTPQVFTQGHFAGRKLKDLASELSLLLSAVAHAGQASSGQAEKSFNRGLKALSPFVEISQLQLFATKSCEPPKIEAALISLLHLSPRSKEAVVHALSEVSLHDEVLRIEEYELLQAICLVLECPLPPLVPAASTNV